jgi:PAS domain S-box-containing protein
MSYEKRTKAQLVEELSSLQKRVEEMEKALAISKNTGSQGDKARGEVRQVLANIVDFIPDAIYAIDAEGKVITWHKGMEKLTGVKAEEMLGKGDHEYSLPFYGVRKPTLIDMVLKPGSAEIEKDFLFIRREGDAFLAETQVLLQGNPRVICGKARPLYDSDGRIIGAIEDIRDVTERKKMEESIQEKERKYQDLVENINEVIYVIENDQRISYISPVVEAFFGYRPAEIEGRPFTDFIFPDDLEVVRDNMKVALEGSISPSEFRVYKKSGDICWVRTTIRPIFRKGLITLHGILADVTDIRIAEKLYKTLANSSQAGVYIAQEGKIQFVNPHIPGYSGYSESELIGMDVLNIVHPEDRDLVKKNALEMLKGIRSAPYEFRMIDGNGQVRWLVGTVTAITYKGKPAILGNTMEIVDRKKSQCT